MFKTIGSAIDRVGNTTSLVLDGVDATLIKGISSLELTEDEIKGVHTLREQLNKVHSISTTSNK